ncbi:MAG: MBL fold metallo-hydrolase, partial [Planctomycetota bacterium]|nr:MBL fold metallo-hydrolase [Planctomycetota bacterium]
MNPAKPHLDSRDLVILPLDPLDRVTGSCTLVFHPASNTRVLIDCGAYQGEPDEQELNDSPFPFDPAEVSVVLLTHGHLDHCGRLPQL